MKINWVVLLRTVEVTVVASVAGFLGSIGSTTGGSFDAKHLKAAGLAALIGLAYKLSGVLSAWLSGLPNPSPTPVPLPPAPPVVPAPVPPAPVVPPAAA